jgi:hypothetical protein
MDNETFRVKKNRLLGLLRTYFLFVRQLNLPQINEILIIESLEKELVDEIENLEKLT